MRMRVAIVTGASRRRGIGAAACLALARSGVDVFFTHWGAYDRKMEWGEEEDAPDYLQEQVSALGVRCEHMAADLSTVGEHEKIMDEVERKMGGAAILVNNATHDPVEAPFDMLDASILDTYYAVNMRGT